MQDQIHSGHAYHYFDKLIRRFETRIEASLRPSFGYSGEVVEARLTQLLVDRLFFPFTAFCAERDRSGQPALPVELERINLAGMKIDQRSGAIGIRPGLLLKSLVTFFLHWGHVLLYIFAWPGGQRHADVDVTTLVIGVGIEGLFDQQSGEDTRFRRFCREGPIEPLQQTRNLIVHSAGAAPTDLETSLKYSRYPTHDLLRSCRLGFGERVKLLFQHLWSVAEFLLAVVRNPILVMLGRDVAYLPMIRSLDAGNKLEAIVITNSVYANQPLWMRSSPKRNFRVHMVWYAQNVVPLVQRADGLVSDYPSYRHMQVDEHWVWTRTFAEYLSSIGVEGDKHVVGPIMWYLPSEEHRGYSLSPEAINVAVFDVTPVRPEVAGRSGFLRMYYNADIMISFVEDIVKLGAELRKESGREVRILLKHKRDYNAGHDRRYIERLEALCAEAVIEIVPHQVNLFTLVNECDVSIVIPNSSPALLAAHVGRHTVYYDPGGSLLANHEPGEFIASASDPAQLLRCVQRAIAENRQHRS